MRIYFLFLTSLFLIAVIFLPTFPTKAAFPGWDNLNYIYYNPAEDDATNNFLQQAANELKNNLGQLGKVLTIATSQPPGPAINLRVDAALPDLSSKNDEAFKLYSDSNGIYITGKTPIAAREGAYTLLDKLGFRWFFKHPAWWVSPNSLISLDGLNEVQEPFYLWRSLWLIGLDNSKIADWAARNRLYGAKHYFFGQNYNEIISETEYQTHPEWFLGVLPPVGHQDWQLVPDNSDVVARAKQYARGLLSATTYHGWNSISRDKYKYGAVSITSNDGGANWEHMWDPYNIFNDWQTITDKIFYLANEVAKDIKADFPGIYVGLLSTCSHTGGTPALPTIELQPNILSVVFAPHFLTLQALLQQIDSFVAKGVQVGVYEFFGGAGATWPNNNPDLDLDKVRALASYAQKGVKFFNGQNGDSWPSTGLTSYLASKMLWDPFQDFDMILTDFYTKAFGPAQTPIRHYYETRDVSSQAVGEGFRDLAEAESLAAGNNEYLERIRQLEYYQRFLWLYHVKGITKLGLDELRNFYVFINKIRDLYVLNYRFTEPAMRDELKNRGLTDSEITALQNFTPPTTVEAAAYLNEALTAFTLSPCDTDPNSCMTQDLVGYWPMNEGTGTVAHDSSDNGNQGVLTNGPQWATGKVGGALQFDGVNDYVNAGNGASLQLSGAHTLEAWINPKAIPSGSGGVIAKYRSSAYPGYLLAVMSNGKVIYTLKKDSTTSANVTSNSAVVPDTWYHIVAVYDGTSMRLYINGVQQTDVESWDIANSFRNTTDNAYIGYLNANTRFNGIIDELRIYNRALSAAEINYHYNLAGSPAPSPVYAAGDLNKDGKVNIYDVSILLSKWGSVNAADLTDCDINAGPGNISQGKIDLFDANKIMANWLP